MQPELGEDEWLHNESGAVRGKCEDAAKAVIAIARQAQPPEVSPHLTTRQTHSHMDLPKL